MKPLFYCTALCAEGARHISPGQRLQRPGFDTPYDFSLYGVTKGFLVQQF
jgi:hypothetical protein